MNNNIKIAPSILACNFSKLSEEIIAIEKAGADLIHLDVMDGHFVPNLTFGPPIIKSIRRYSKLVFDTHLMVQNPDDLLEEYANAGSDLITVHVEACNNLVETLERIRSLGCKAGVALKPKTDPLFLTKILDKIDLILVMTVNPGFGGQKFINEMLKKITVVKSLIGSNHIDLEVDGGITQDNAKLVVKAGANILVAGSSIFGNGDEKKYKLNINSMR